MQGRGMSAPSPLGTLDIDHLPLYQPGLDDSKARWVVSGQAEEDSIPQLPSILFHSVPSRFGCNQELPLQEGQGDSTEDERRTRVGGEGSTCQS